MKDLIRSTEPDPIYAIDDVLQQREIRASAIDDYGSEIGESRRHTLEVGHCVLKDTDSCQDRCPRRQTALIYGQLSVRGLGSLGNSEDVEQSPIIDWMHAKEAVFARGLIAPSGSVSR